MAREVRRNYKTSYNFAGRRGEARPDFDAKRKKEKESRLKIARQSHEVRFYGAFLAFLVSALPRLEETLPEAYRAFHAQEMSTYKFHQARAGKSKMSAEVVAQFWQDDIRARRLEEFAKENPRSGIPGFWQWDEKLNPDRFDPASV